MAEMHPLTRAVIDGDKATAVELTQKCVDEGEAASVIVEQRLVPGMAVIGEQFQRDEIFVPEMLIAANAMKASLVLLEPLIAESGVKAPPTLLTTTVPNMRKAVEAVKATGVDTKVLIGGAPVSAEFAEEVGADGFAEDAGAAAEVAKSIVSAA